MRVMKCYRFPGGTVYSVRKGLKAEVVHPNILYVVFKALGDLAMD